MTALFSPSSNVTFWVVLILLALGVGAAVAVPMIVVRLPAKTGQGQAPEQPVPFDHQHHATRSQIDCLFCHPRAATQAKADIPTTERCMGCHQQIWSASPMLARVRDSFRQGQPLVWQRVNQMPGFVYFNHAVHLHQGVACVTCHGQVEQMARIRQEAPLLMQWCLECHRSPERALRPRDKVTSAVWRSDQAPGIEGAQLASQRGTRRITHCTACHR